MDLLSDLGTTDTVVVPNLLSSLPFIRIQRFGGPSDVVFDNPRVTVDAFAATRADAYTLAENIRRRLSTPQRLGTAAGLLDRAIVETGPSDIPWGPNVTRISTTYAIDTRRTH